MDDEIYIQALRKTLQLGDHILCNNQQEATFLRFGTVWYGRLANPGCIPGLYLDRNTIIASIGENELSIKTKDISYKNSDLLYQRCKLLPPNWQQIDLKDDAISLSLPLTEFVEGDIALLTDASHPTYNSEDDYKNQYTVYRINYDSANQGSPKYRLRAGKAQIDADESQLVLAARGPISIFYSNENTQLRWKSLKDEAEFYLLLGRYTRLFNLNQMSYKWHLAEARQQISGGNGDGVLQMKDHYYVVKYLDREIGIQVSCSPELILDI